jgi:hypothetical protein
VIVASKRPAESRMSTRRWFVTLLQEKLEEYSDCQYGVKSCLGEALYL